MSKVPLQIVNEVLPGLCLCRVVKENRGRVAIAIETLGLSFAVKDRIHRSPRQSRRLAD